MRWSGAGVEGGLEVKGEDCSRLTSSKRSNFVGLCTHTLQVDGCLGVQRLEPVGEGQAVGRYWKSASILD
jgi:hypothetical protein